MEADVTPAEVVGHDEDNVGPIGGSGLDSREAPAGEGEQAGGEVTAKARVHGKT